MLEADPKSVPLYGTSFGSAFSSDFSKNIVIFLFVCAGFCQLAVVEFRLQASFGEQGGASLKHGRDILVLVAGPGQGHSIH